MQLAAAPLVSFQKILAEETLHSLGRNLNCNLRVPLQIHSICPAYVGRCQIFLCVAEGLTEVFIFIVSKPSPSPSPLHSSPLATSQPGHSSALFIKKNILYKILQ